MPAEIITKGHVMKTKIDHKMIDIKLEDDVHALPHLQTMMIGGVVETTVVDHLLVGGGEIDLIEL